MNETLRLRLDRRRLLLATAGLAGTGLLVACGGDDDDDDDPPTSGQDPTATTAATATGATPTSGTTAGGTTTSATEPAAEGEPKPGGTLLIGQDFGPQDMDPTISGAWASTNIQELIFTALLRWSPDMELEPDLATKYEAVDELTYDFTLRDNVTFHNGKAFSAEDVIFTIERIKDPEVASPRINSFADVQSVEALSDTSVQFKLAKPVAPLLRFLATIPTGAIVPAGATDDELNTQAPGTGAFKFIEHVLDQEVKLEKHDGYYEEGLPYLDAVTFRLLADDTSITSALRSESVQMAWLKDPKVAQNVSETTDGLQSVPGVSSRYIPIHFNLTKAPFDDVRVRRAMSLALDRQAIVDAVLGGFGSVGTFLPPSQLGGYEGDGSDLPYYTQDIDGAKALLTEAGQEGLEIAEFKIVAANQLDVQGAQVMAQQWAEAGITVNILPMEVGAIIDDWNAGNYTMAMVGTVWAPDPSSEVTRLYSKSAFGKNAGMSDAELDALIEQGLAETDPDKRGEIYSQIQQHALEQVYTIIPYTYPLRWELVWDYVHGYDVMASNARLSVRKTWLDT